ncbi:RNA polymerase sigma factor 54, interaction domain protein, partial [mine drainage metagenome]
MFAGEYAPDTATLIDKRIPPVPAAPGVANPAHLPTGTSAAIRTVIALIRQVAVHDSTVLILGESGTGKEVAARAVHE